MNNVDQDTVEELKEWFEHCASVDAPPSRFMFTNESYFKSFFHNANHGILIINDKYEIVDCNPFMVTLMSTSPAELRTKELKDIIADKHINHDYVNVTSIIKGTSYSMNINSEIKERFKSSHLIPVKIICTRIPSNLSDSFKYVIVHIYPVNNAYASMATGTFDEKTHGIPEHSNVYSLLQTIIQAKWFGWVIGAIVMLTALSGQLSDLVKALIKLMGG